MQHISLFHSTKKKKKNYRILTTTKRLHKKIKKNFTFVRQVPFSGKCFKKTTEYFLKFLFLFESTILSVNNG